MHVALLVAAVAVYPILPGPGWKPPDGLDPAGRILLLLSASVGLPYFVLSATGPLVQAWFARDYPGRSPYRLYSLSNVGSLLALLTYPFLIEPAFALGSQALYWEIGFVVFGLLCGVSGDSGRGDRAATFVASGGRGAGRSRRACGFASVAIVAE